MVVTYMHAFRVFRACLGQEDLLNPGTDIRPRPWTTNLKRNLNENSEYHLAQDMSGVARLPGLI